MLTVVSCPIRLGMRLQELGMTSRPMTSSSLCLSLQSSYVVDIDVHVPWAPDIEVRQPLVIKPPSNTAVSTSMQNQVYD